MTNRTKFKMLGFLLIITSPVIAAGVVSDSEREQVKSGESVNLRVKTTGLGNMTKVTLQKNCENRTGGPIIRYCSPEEEKSGCIAKKSERFSIKFDTGSFSVTFVDARVSDGGCYSVSYIDVANIVKEKLFNVTVQEQLSSTISPESGMEESLETHEDFPKGKDTLWKISDVKWLAAGIAFLTAVMILVFIFAINYIHGRKQKKKQRKPDADDEEDNLREDISLNSNINGASKPATDDSLEMVDETVANNNQRSKKDLNHGA